MVRRLLSVLWVGLAAAAQDPSTFQRQALLLTGKAFTFPVEGGELVAHDVEFGRVPGYDSRAIIPDLRFKLENSTHHEWKPVVIRVTIGALCDGVPRQLEAKASALAFYWEKSPDRIESTSTFEQSLDALDNKLNGCKLELLQMHLQSAGWNGREWIPAEVPKVDMIAELTQIQRQREELTAAAARGAAIADQERKKKDAEEAAVRAKAQAATAAKAARECRALYLRTVDKRLADLTIRESKNVQACEALGLYSDR